jgi:hypothetical protein
LLAPSKAIVMRFKLKDVLKKEESKWDKNLSLGNLGNLGNLACLPLKSTCDEIQVERCVEERRK